ncbi:MAG TPA: malto-oligosyltrehalose synthase [Gemmatimonadaceae bacterium]|nr:malto-oligosyltrehalose synthase [Gemmatimonadaceae bacterium]
MLTSTYRLQFNARFTLRDALSIVGYLDALGISHVYASPLLAARPGSTHGYDVADPTRINPELGTEDDLRELSESLRARGMGLILDIVPNHMGIGPSNPFWEDLLRHGQGSQYASWFDVEWNATDADRGHLVLPVLGAPLEQVLARGEIGLGVSESGGVRITYHDTSFPVDPATLPAALELAVRDPGAGAELVASHASGPEGRANLADLLARQHYRLSYWRDASWRINYRRFFDINDLAGVRVEDPAVFDATHERQLAWVERGWVQGFRVDHVDGLRDPRAYLERLRAESEVAARIAGLDEFPIYVEKILSPGEHLRREWPVQGTTGYEYMNDLEALFLDAEGARHVERNYRMMRRLGEREGSPAFRDAVRDGKLRVLRGPLRADMRRLARRLAALGVTAELDDAHASADPAALRRAPTGARLHPIAAGIVRFIAECPVYRTYIDGRSELPHDDDRSVIEQTTARAQEGASESEHAVIGRIAQLFLRPLRHGDEDFEGRLRFIMPFQQTTGPATAKGVEDTALYAYVPLVSRNEVGGEPDRPLHDALERLHAGNAERARDWPLAMLSTNTHDTKRSADVRARLDVLSEVPDLWRRAVARWRRLNRRHRVAVGGKLAPDANTEYLLYQTLVGMWPPPRPGRRVDDAPSREWLEEAAGRVERYMLKAMKEAKTFTSWTDPDPAFEEAVKGFVRTVLLPENAETDVFLSDVSRLVARVAPAGALNALARICVHYTSPGVPDTYQGDELWFRALVDPDNRRDVDYALRSKLLSALATSLDATASAELMEDSGSDRLKLHVVRALLRVRRAHPDLFRRGSYEPVEILGERAEHAFAFLRRHEETALLVVVPRLTAGCFGKRGQPLTALAESIELKLPAELEGRVWQSVLTGQSTSDLGVVQLLAPLPIAVLTSSGNP